MAAAAGSGVPNPAASEEVETELAEAQVAQALSQPLQPTAEMVEAHNLTHLPFRPWCAACVRGRGKCNPHRLQGARPGDLYPVIVMDYIADHESPILVLVDRRSKTH